MAQNKKSQQTYNGGKRTENLFFFRIFIPIKITHSNGALDGHK